MNECTYDITTHSEDHIVMYILNIPNFSQMIGLHMTKYSHTCMIKYNEK
jgi:hypothetical protein